MRLWMNKLIYFDREGREWSAKFIKEDPKGLALVSLNKQEL